eukprot:10744761-Alexandrium_andersonii.AAC.1
MAFPFTACFFTRSFSPSRAYSEKAPGPGRPRDRCQAPARQPEPLLVKHRWPPTAPQPAPRSPRS